jgi:hypothetical protein
MISSQDAFLILEKWKKEKRFLYIFTSTPDGSAKFQALVSEVLRKSESLIVFAERSDGGTTELGIELKGAEFEYGDPRETFDPELAATGWVCFLSAFLPSGGSIMFAERV